MISEKLAAGGSVYGTMLRVLRDPAVIPLAQTSGLDFVMLDMEHGAYSVETMADLALAGGCAGFPVLVRVPELARSLVSRALDNGVAGVMVPMLDTVEQAREFVKWAKYPPVGGRGLSSQGGHTVYRRFDNVESGMERMNRETLAIAQIETVESVESIDGIAAVPGIDVLLIGPNDLSVSLGHPGNLDTPEQRAMIQRVADAARRHGKVFGMHAPAAYMAPWTSQGMRFFMNSIDVGIIQKGFTQVSEETRRIGPRPG